MSTPNEYLVEPYIRYNRSRGKFRAYLRVEGVLTTHWCQTIADARQWIAETRAAALEVQPAQYDRLSRKLDEVLVIAHQIYARLHSTE